MRRALTTLLALTLGIVVAAPAEAAPKRNPGKAAEISAYWTQERIKNAKPRDRAKPGGGGATGGTTGWSTTSVPAPYGGTHALNGKVLMTIQGVNYQCSGTAVTSTTSGVNLVWTAGHCVTDGPNAEATNVTFIPAYRGSAQLLAEREPYGRWVATAASDIESTPGWTGQGPDKFRWDVGAARVEKVGAPDATFTGSLPTPGTRSLAFGQDPNGKRLLSYGYPAAGKYNGQTQYQCSSPFRAWDDVEFLDPMKISCGMTGGSSGGGWFLDANGNNISEASEPLVSVNSYGYQGEKNTMYGPFMNTVTREAPDDQAQRLYDAMK